MNPRQYTNDITNRCRGAARAAAILAILSANAGADVGWIEQFGDDPVVAGRFAVPPGHNGARFTHDPVGHLLTVHYDTSRPTAWYTRHIDPVGGRSLGRCDDFEFAVQFRIRSAGFFADPLQSAQIGWGLINAQTTGEDRAGGTAGPYAFDVVALDFFPNVSPLFGGPTIGPVVIHSDQGQGFFTAIDFTFGAETRIDTALGDEFIALDAVYTARVAYRAAWQTASLTIAQGQQPLAINTDGAGGPGGFDGDAATIQTILSISGPFDVDTFALTAWQDTFNPFEASVIADVDIMEIRFFAPDVVKGDLNGDGLVNGADMSLFVETLLAAAPSPCLVPRADFDENGTVTPADIAGFLTALLAS